MLVVDVVDERVHIAEVADVTVRPAADGDLFENEGGPIVRDGRARTEMGRWDSRRSRGVWHVTRGVRGDVCVGKIGVGRWRVREGRAMQDWGGVDALSLETRLMSGGRGRLGV